MTDDALCAGLEARANRIRELDYKVAQLDEKLGDFARKHAEQREEIARLKEEAAHAQTCWEGLCDDERKAEAERDEALSFIADRGYQRCTNPACNCGKWHGGHLQMRHGEIDAALGESGVEWAGTTLATVKALVAQRDEAREEVARLKGEYNAKELHEWRDRAALLEHALNEARAAALREGIRSDAAFAERDEAVKKSAINFNELINRPTPAEFDAARQERDEWQGRCAWLAHTVVRHFGETQEVWLRRSATHWRDLTQANAQLREQVATLFSENKEAAIEVRALKADAEKWREREARIDDQNRGRAAELRRQADKLDAARAKGKE